MTSPGAEPSSWEGAFHRLVNLSGLSVGLCIFLIAVFVSYDVIARTFFLMTNSWVTEVTMYLMGYVTFMGAAFALKEGSHVSVDMLVERVQPAARRLLGMVSGMVMLVSVGLLTWLSFWFFMDAWDSNEVSDTLLSVHLWIPYLFFFLGMAWLLLTLIVRACAARCTLDQKDAHD